MLFYKQPPSIYHRALVCGLLLCLIPGLSTALTSTDRQSPSAEQQRANDVRHSYEIMVIDRLLEQFHYK